MKARFFTFIGLLTVALGVLTSCSDAIFATIETEKKVATNTLPLLLSIFDIAVTSPGSTYYVAAGAVFQGSGLVPGGTLNWSPNMNDTSRPFNPPGTLLCNAMVFYPVTNTLWAGFITSSGAPALFQSSPGPNCSFAASTPITDPSIVNKQATLLKVANGHLFMVSTVDTSSYELDYQSNGASLWSVQKSGLTSPITGIGWDGTNFWMTSGTSVYIDSADPPTFPTGSPNIGSYTIGSTINSVFVDPVIPGRVFIVTKTDGIYYTLNSSLPAGWVHIGADQPSGSSTVASYLTVAGPIDTGNRFYLVGSDGFGYYTLDTSGSGSMSRFGDTTILLFSSSVSRILVDNSPPPYVNVFIGTNLNGLWRAVFDSSSGQILSGTNQYWIHE